MSAPDPSENLPPRIVHLLGGLRAVDERDGHIRIQVAADRGFGAFAAPQYSHLYASLRSLGLIPIGVEFVSNASLRGLIAPDWACASESGFRILEERDEWDQIGHAAHEDRDGGVANLSSRATTYLDLLPLRILELSNAYNRTLRAWHMGDDKKPGRLFRDTFMPYLDAAIHGFVADAASLRDLIAEAVWTLLVRGSPGVTTLGTFIKKADASAHPLAARLINEGTPGGWLKAFTDLRNELTHVAPVGRSQIFHFCEAREKACGENFSLVTLHYPLLESSGAVRRVGPDLLDLKDESAVKAQLEDYRVYMKSSIDGLDYAWRTLQKLVDLLREVRLASGLRGFRPVITDQDVIGEIKVTRE